MNKNIFIPPEFEYHHYIKEANIENFTYEEALEHYYSTGKSKGFSGSSIGSYAKFIDFCKNLPKNNALEIGPASNPALTGQNVKYFDVIDSQECIERAKKFNLSYENVPPKIHFVSKTADMSIINETFDFVISCHNIEHQLDIILHLNEVARILDNNGIYACIIPDKRFTFDYYRPKSTLFEIISQHFDNKSAKRHPLRNFLEEKFLVTHNEPARHWNGDHGIKNEIYCNINRIISDYMDKNYIDCHRWIFTYDSFKEIINTLYNENLITLKLIRCYNVPRNDFSFFCLFSK